MDNIKLYRKINELESKIDSIAEQLCYSNQIEFLTRKQVMKILSIGPATLDRWSKKGKLKRYGIEGRFYYKSNELTNNIVEL